MYTTLPRPDFDLFTIQLWQVWSGRNKLLVDQIREPAKVIIQRSLSIHDSLQNLNPQSAPQPVSLVSAWKKPWLNSYKINTDAAFGKDLSPVGLGVVIRNSEG
ncbi:uncharacterized protein LOC126675183 [Mercurialis annua]|uniref:uncharacterized protein LOC126675183 n=1 Tax=Mercurialis annua TaxID=3986 RepID=UPI00215E404A|nr:uncharacterized protein LOC126675183 [Mercurialis annua]